MYKSKFIYGSLILALAVGVFIFAAPPRSDEISRDLSFGIQWYSTLDSGLEEAKRTGRPILFLSALPSCGGVPGIW